MKLEKQIARDFVWLVIGIALGFMIFGSNAAMADDDDRYVGLHITVPLTFDSVGAQVIVRRDNTEARAGIDGNKNYQIGLGLTAFTSVVPSAGMAFSSHHKDLVPYAGIRADYDNDWEAGAVTYGANKDTSYLFAGARFNDDGDDNGRNNSGDNDRTDGGGDNGNGGGDSGDDGGDGDGGDGGGDGGSDSGGNPNSHSGLGDGTNPGRGKGRDNSPNSGNDNPHN